MQQQQISPEQKKQFDLALKQAMAFITDGERAKLIVAKAEKVGPERATLEAMMPLLKTIHGSAQSSGVELDVSIVMAVGMHVLKVLAELFIMSGLLTEDKVEAFAKTVSAQAVQQHNATAQQPQQGVPA